MNVTVRAVAFLLVVLGTLVLAPQGFAGDLSRELMPGVGYERRVLDVAGRSVRIHVVTTPAPTPGGLYELKPVLSHDTITGRESVTAMQQRLAGVATAVGINGDLFNVEDGYPSGMFMRDGIIHGRPVSTRSTLGIGLDGLLRIARVGFYGTWGVSDLPRESLDHLNRPLEAGEVGLFTPAWGGATPVRPGAVDIVLSAVPATVPNVDLTATIAAVMPGGGTAIPPGGAVLQATGARTAGLAAIAQPGAPLVLKLILKPWWDQVADAIGGGPALVRKGRIALPTTEAFTASQLLPRHARSAVGQLADGRILFLVVDGAAGGSAGVTMRQLADVMRDLGAQTAMALDGGGSSTLAFDGSQLNTSEAGERGVADALMLFYYGVFAAAPSFAVTSPNGDGVAEPQRLSYRLVRGSAVDARLIGPDGQIAWSDAGQRDPGTYPIPDEVLAGLAEGQWRLSVTAADVLGASSQAERAFSVNNTLGFLSLSKDVVKVRPKKGGSVSIGFRLAHPAHVLVTVEDGAGMVVRTVYANQGAKPGELLLSWNGKNGQGKVVRKGRYTIRVLAENGFGAVELARRLTVRRA